MKRIFGGTPAGISVPDTPLFERAMRTKGVNRTSTTMSSVLGCNQCHDDNFGKMLRAIA